MKKVCLSNITLHGSARCFDLNLTEKIITDAPICESGSLNLRKLEEIMGMVQVRLTLTESSLTFFTARTLQYVAKIAANGLFAPGFGQKISNSVNQSVNLTFQVSEPCRMFFIFFWHNYYSLT